MVHPEYEFDGSQNSLLRDLAKKMGFVGVFGIIIGILMALGGFALFSQGAVEGFSNIVQGVITIIIGIWTQKAANSFKLIVDTRGHDIENLMGALGELRNLYALQYWVLIIALIFIALGVVLVFIAALSGG